MGRSNVVGIFASLTSSLIFCIAVSRSVGLSEFGEEVALSLGLIGSEVLVSILPSPGFLNPVLGVSSSSSSLCLLFLVSSSVARGEIESIFSCSMFSLFEG